MRVAAVIPHWNRSELLSALLASMARQTRPFDEVLVIDNGSTDDSASVAARAGARFLAMGSNLGFVGAVNRGIQEANADWIAILNNDVTLQADWLERLLASAQNYSFATGKILSAADPSKIDAAFDEVSRAGCAWRCGSGKPDSPTWNTPRAIRMAPMTAALFRAELFREIGLLDLRFESYLEDIDFGLRCAARGKKGVYDPESVVYHRGSATLGEWNSDTVRRIARNQIFLIAKHFRGQPLYPIVAGQLLWGLVALRHLRGFAYLRGKLEGLRALRTLRIDTTTDSSLAEILRQSEQSILDLQRETGFDTYWRAYFCLSRP